MMFEEFVTAIRNKHLVEIHFRTKAGDERVRVCVPLDFGPSRRNIQPNPSRYHFWDLDSPDGPHILSIVSEQLLGIKLLDRSFEPSDYVTWKPDWHIERDSGEES